MSAMQPRRMIGLNVALLCGSLLVAAGCSPSSSTSTVATKTGGKTGSSSGGAGTTSGSGGSSSATGGSNASGGTTGSGSGGLPGATGGAATGTGGTSGGGGAVGSGGESSGGGSTGSGGDSGSGGAGGTGLTGSGGMGGMGFMISCEVSQAQAAGKVVAIAPLISDFTYVDGTTDVKEGSFSFGNFYDAPSGYSFHYPDRGSASTGGAGGAAGAAGASGGAGGGATATGGRGGAAGMAGGALGPVGITENLTGGDWHISGVIGNYSGFVVSLACATDASAFSGIQFTISGTAGTPNRLTMQAAFAGDEAGSRVTPMIGMCEGTCSAPFTTITLTATKTLVQIPWSTFTGGRPISTVNPAQLTALRWIFNWSPTMQPYAVDLRIDDLSFIPAAGTTTDAGTD